VACVSIGLPFWYVVKLGDFCYIRDENDHTVIREIISIAGVDKECPSGSMAMEGDDHDDKATPKYLTYGLFKWCQNYALDDEATGSCISVPPGAFAKRPSGVAFSNHGVSASAQWDIDYGQYWLSLHDSKAGFKVETAVGRTIVMADDYCCQSYDDNVITWKSNSTNFWNEWRSDAKNAWDQMTKNVQTTTSALAIVSVSWQFLAFLFGLIALCCGGSCSSTFDAILYGLTFFFYMVTGAYWANNVGSKTDTDSLSDTASDASDMDDVFSDQCLAWSKAYQYSYSKSLGDWDDFASCRSFWCYWVMWINFACMFILFCMMLFSAYKSRQHDPSEEELRGINDGARRYDGVGQEPLQGGHSKV
jgi:TRAP-type C4-dicarboxylate transport system permease small subunit